MVMTTATRALSLRGRQVPVVFPNVRDARLHTAAVIISIHFIGITALGFRVSVPQILIAILTAGLLDVALTYPKSGNLVWPASGMLTGSGVALILRITGMGSGEYWSWEGWYWFALVAGASLLTTYFITFRGRHIFNPSNIGLVLAFLIVGSNVIEPLDFWWAPPGPYMILAYALIIGGGIAITQRLYLLEMALAFWAVLAMGLAVLSLSGHCMIATWSPGPVCGGYFWASLVSSPEVLIFLFFMITDPKTVPTGREARVAFAAPLALAATLLIAPNTVEYGAKVGLLGSLALWSPMRSLFERWLPAAEAQVGPGSAGIIRSLAAATTVRVFARGAIFGVIAVLGVVAIVAAGIPARSLSAYTAPTPEVAFPLELDDSSLPQVTVDPSVSQLAIAADDEFVESVTQMLAENLAGEAEAIRTADGSILGFTSGGDRLTEMQARLDAAIATGEREASFYSFDSLHLSAHEAIGQVSAGLVFTAIGTIESVRYDSDGNEIGREAGQFESAFVLRQLAGERWVIVSVVMETD